MSAPKPKPSCIIVAGKRAYAETMGIGVDELGASMPLKEYQALLNAIAEAGIQAFKEAREDFLP